MPRSTTQYKLSGTTTFRLSSTKLLGRWGGNLQNIEKSARKRFVPDAGKVFVQTDQAGAEALVVAHCMPATNKLRQLFDNKIKIHCYLAVAFASQWEKEWPVVHEFRDIPINELKNHSQWPAFVKAVAKSDENPPATRYYYHYKMVAHSANYGIQANTFVENLLLKSKGAVCLTTKQGEAYLEGYHKLIPELRGYYHRWTARQYETTGILRNLQGYPIHLTRRLHEHEYTKIHDKVPQSTVGTITNEAFTELQSYIEDNRLDWDLLANTHDSYMCQCPEGEVLVCAAKMKEYMERELTSPFGEKFRMRSETQAGYNWSPAKDGSNINGLKEIKI